MSELATVRVDRGKPYPVVAVDGEVDLSNAQRVFSEVAQGLDPAAPVLILDLSRTTYIDSAALNGLFALGRELRHRRHRLCVVAPETAFVRRVLTIASIDAVAALVSSIEEAHASSRE